MEDPIISHGPSNMEAVTTMHDDALVVWATIVNYNVTRVFVDLGSFVNIHFKEAFN